MQPLRILSLEQAKIRFAEGFRWIPYLVLSLVCLNGCDNSRRPSVEPLSIYIYVAECDDIKPVLGSSRELAFLMFIPVVLSRQDVWCHFSSFVAQRVHVPILFWACSTRALPLKCFPATHFRCFHFNWLCLFLSFELTASGLHLRLGSVPWKNSVVFTFSAVTTNLVWAVLIVNPSVLLEFGHRLSIRC